MANVTIKALSDGPYDIPGGAKLLDQQRQGIRRERARSALPLPLRRVEEQTSLRQQP